MCRPRDGRRREYECISIWFEGVGTSRLHHVSLCFSLTRQELAGEMPSWRIIKTRTG